MRFILQAFAKRNPYIGYCQGMNFVLQFLMTMKFSEEVIFNRSFKTFTQKELFWILAHLLEVVLPLDYYSTMTGVIVDEKILHEMIEVVLPEVAQKLKEIELDTSIFSIPWLVCLFTSTKLNEKIIFVIWDHLFIEGSVALLKAALAILKSLRKELAKANNLVDAVKIIEENTKNIDNPKDFNQKMNSFKISKKVLNFAREKFRAFIVEGKENNNKKLAVRRKKSNNQSIHCDPNWPICSFVVENAKNTKSELEYFIFKQAQPNTKFIYNNYFEYNEEKIPHKHQIPFVNTKDNLVIGRFHHICLDLEEEKKSLIKEIPTRKQTNNDFLTIKKKKN